MQTSNGGSREVASDVATTSPLDKPPVDVDSAKNTLRVAVLLCLVCSVLVSVFAVALKGTQDRNKQEFLRKNVLQAAGIWSEDSKVDDESFGKLSQALVYNFETHQAREDADAVKLIDVETDSKNPEKSDKIVDDVAGIKRREKETIIYKVTVDGSQIVVLPVRGYGLWSTLWGFIALDVSDAKTAGPESIVVKGLTYFDQKETPGLGGEVDNPLWKQKWIGKKVFDENWNVKAKVTKGAEGLYEVDAISGATITSRGVTNMLSYWLGDEGFGPYLRELGGAPPAGPPEEHNGHDDDDDKHQEAGEDDHGQEKKNG